MIPHIEVSMANKLNLRGVFTALITPFQNEGRDIDYGAYRELIERQISAGITGIVPCGTTGESPTLDHKEHTELISKSVAYANGKIQVIAGTGSNSTKEAIALTKAANDLGVDGVMLVNPYYNKPSQEGLYQHFTAISNVSNCPVVLYNIKGRTAVNLEVETLKRLSSHDSIVAVKEASGDPGQMARIILECNDDIEMLCGDDNITPVVMALGGSGVISVAANIYPQTLVKMVEFYLTGDFDSGNKIFYNLLPFMNSMFWETNPVPVKAAHSIKHHGNSFVRLPLVSLNEEKTGKIRDIMTKLGELM